MKKTFLLCLILTTCTFAQNQWKRALLKQGTVVRDIAINKDNTLFFSSDIGVISSKQSISLRLRYYIQTVAINSKQHLFALTAHHGLFRSTDKGHTWTMVLIVNAPGTNKYNITITEEDHIYFTANGTDLHRSFDNGDTWEITYLSQQIKGITSNSQDELFGYDTGTGLWSSKDKGQDWKLVDSKTPTYNCTAMVINDQGHIFMGKFHGEIIRSEDNGRSWKVVHNNIYRDINSMAIDSQGNMYAAIERGGVIRSTDEGNTWQAFNYGLTNTDVYDIAISSNNKIYITTDGGVWFMELENKVQNTFSR
ncbi:WD40/YVTN/BNR-like repeat-containing protein [Candidatus Uabimicrobium amorphum]|uniref:Ycf48-like protein n=1 Tax=Uabimicrobium amorphum TaxID=2596890 RepID=A0A5S9ILH8_UABAM|nr:hypothetical protein [Candidatus Uabimicrobium amorphum]BBM84088.1 Ycf48-like protein [Candidatus Uabimicrobium amorphum]